MLPPYASIYDTLAHMSHIAIGQPLIVSLGGSNWCADQLTNWDGTQKVGLGNSVKRKEPRGFSL